MKNFVTVLLVFLAGVSMALNPSREYEVMPEDFGMDYEDLTIKTEDGINLYCWKFKPMERSAKTVIVSDDGEGNMVDNIEIIAQFVSLGYNVISYDYRGYGKSDEFRISPKFYIYAQFSRDLDAVIKYVKKYDAKQRVTLWGVGVGAGLSVAVGSNNVKVSNIIADAPYTDLETMKRKYKEVKDIDIMMPLGFDKLFVEPLYALQEKGNHVEKYMFIIGGNDKLITVDEIKIIMKPKKKVSTLYIVPETENPNNFTVNKNEYFNQVKKFLNQ